MANQAVLGYVDVFGKHGAWIGDHTGPASYTPWSAPSTGGDVVKAINFGLRNIDFIIPLGKTVSGNYEVKAKISSGGGSHVSQATLIWYSAAASTTVVPVTPGTSPYAYTAPAAGAVSVTGGTVTVITITRGGTTITTGATFGVFPVLAGDVVTVTYSAAPTMDFFPSGMGTQVASGTNLSSETIRMMAIGG